MHEHRDIVVTATAQTPHGSNTPWHRVGACTHKKVLELYTESFTSWLRNREHQFHPLKRSNCDNVWSFQTQKSFPTAPQPCADPSRDLANKKCKNFTRKNCNIKTTDLLSALRLLSLHKGLAITKFKSALSTTVKSKVQRLSHQSMYGKVEFPDTQSFQKAKHVLLKLVEKPSDQITEMEQF